jgi:threo-3-hydroxy-L-aspartate ammonia-lyase
MTSPPTILSFQAIEQAARQLHSVAKQTPALSFDFFDSLIQGHVWLKAECFQRTGSFKFRGAYNALANLSSQDRQSGVLTYSSGNHAQALALAGNLLNASITVIMPSDAPTVKKEGTRSYGAEVIEYHREEITREELCKQIAAERKLTVIPPYDHLDVMAGQGTIALELLSQVKTLDAIFVCVGGGGLISGCATAIKKLLPNCQVIGVEPSTADDATRSFHSGTLQTVKDPQTIADGARTPSLGHFTFPVVMNKVDEMITVSEEELLEALSLLWTKGKIFAEPTGALALAGMIKKRATLREKNVGIIVSGGNVDPKAIWPLLTPYL